jgi:hypothetical protein
MVVGISGGTNTAVLNDTTLRKVNMAIWAFTFSPFLLSSNLLVVVGLMKADRVIYLPLFGFCLLEALALSKLLKGARWMLPGFETRQKQMFWGAHFFLMAQLIIFSNCGSLRITSTQEAIMTCTTMDIH